MCKMRVSAVATVVAAICWFTPLAHAQATRTWVSGVGDDANPCSRTAPCKTFAGAISKTATAGEIDTLDPGGFGAVTITRSMTIDGTAGLGGVLATLSSNGIIVNAAAGSVVILRNLDINGVGTGARGVLILGAGDVHVENCKIFGFATRGIEDTRTSGRLLVTDTVVSNIGQTGILTLPPSASTLAVTLDRVQLNSNGNAGFAITGGTQAIVSRSVASGNVHGFFADTNSALNLDDSSAFGNTNSGINSQTGAVIRLSNSTVTGNGTGISTSGGSVLSFGSNRIAGNGAGNAPTGTIAVQ